ncbi:MAG: amidohydrolase family protein [Oscillibacter sp.]|nr:amidohydrolase family protein [Oscillibacter sp.]MCI9374970.1 amidohydrolase family protein [Oscillibacter sp.]
MEMFDLIFRNGKVFDSVQACFTKQDVAVMGDKIAKVGNLPGETAAVEIDAEGCMVVPGLIDGHLHLFTKGSDEGIPPDLSLLPNGITAAVDGGTAGVSTYDAFHQIDIQNSLASVKACLNVSSLGMLHAKVFENTRVEDYEEARLLETAQRYRGEIIALKLRYSLDLNPQMPIHALARCVELAEKMELPLVVHVTNPPVDMSAIADKLRPGDVFCHCFQGKGNTILAENGRVKAAVWEAKRRGVLFDASNGTNNYCHAIAQAAMAEGFYPDFITTDGSHVFHSYYKPRCFTLPYLMSKYLALGMSLEDVFQRTTWNAARFAGWTRKGVLAEGFDADISVFKSVRKEAVFADFRDDIIRGDVLLVPQMTVKAGTIVYRQVTFS